MSYLYALLGGIIKYVDLGVYSLFGIHNIGLCIILFTIITYAIMIPLNAKQQKSSRLMNKINPEIKAIQEKYKGKKDQDSMMKQNQETQAVYTKYGISPFGGCLPLLISMPIIIALYGVIREITKYAPDLKNGTGFLGLDVTKTPTEFFGDKVNHPYGWVAFIIPVLAVVFQFINTKMLSAKNDGNNKSGDDSMAQSMKMMNYFMPFMSGFFCLSLSMAIGLYWITGSIFRIVQAYFINRSVDSISLEELVEKNKEKAAKKTKKQEEMNQRMEMYSKQRTSSIKSASSYQNNSNSSSDKSSNVSVNKNVKPGSISGYANMLSGNSDKKDK